MVAELNLFHYFIGDRRRMSFKYDSSLRVRLEKVNKQLDLPFATTVGFLLLAGYLYIKNNTTVRNKPYVASGCIRRYDRDNRDDRRRYSDDYLRDTYPRGMSGDRE